MQCNTPKKKTKTFSKKNKIKNNQEIKKQLKRGQTSEQCTCQIKHQRAMNGFLLLFCVSSCITIHYINYTRETERE